MNKNDGNQFSAKTGGDWIRSSFGGGRLFAPCRDRRDPRGASFRQPRVERLRVPLEPGSLTFGVGTHANAPIYRLLRCPTIRGVCCTSRSCSSGLGASAGPQPRPRVAHPPVATSFSLSARAATSSSSTVSWGTLPRRQVLQLSGQRLPPPEDATER